MSENENTQTTNPEVSQSTKDCRLCEQYLKGLNRCYLEYNDIGVCTDGDNFIRAEFTPLWVAAKPSAS